MEEKKYLKRKQKALDDGNREQIAISCKHLGDYYNEQGRYLQAVKEYQDEANIYSKTGKKLEMAKAYRMVGEMFMLLGEFDNAKENINNYLKTVKKLLNKVEEQRAYATLGRAHLLHGQALSESSASDSMTQLKQAEKSFLKSLLLTKELTGQISKQEQLDMQARCYLNIGVVKEHMEDFEEAIVYIEKATKISISNDIFELTHMCHVSMSLLYHVKKNDPILALRYCNLALDAAKRLSQKVKKLCETLIIKSEILIKEGDFASAKKILTKAYKKNTPDENDRLTIEKSLKIVVKICQILDQLVTTSSVDYEQRKTLYEKLGDGCCHLNNFSKALEFYLKMLECAQLNKESGKSLIPIYVSLYQTYSDNKQYDQALEYLWKEYELNKDVTCEAITTLCSIAEICELQNQSFWTIQGVYQKAKDQCEKLEGRPKLKFEKVIYARLRKLQNKHNMNVLAEELEQEAIAKGIKFNTVENDSDTESENNTENNTPDLGDDVCLDDLTDSDTSDLDETDKQRPHRATRGTRALTIKRNNKGETQLHQACISGNIELVRRLIDQGHVVNVRDHAGWLPLHEACNHGFRDIVELLLTRGATVAINDKGGTSCDGITPLYDACSNGFLDVIELLLEHGADATVKTDFGETCINGLDKWRSSATLNEGEQAQYEVIRNNITKKLSKIGIVGATMNTKPLTNANVKDDSDSTDMEYQSFARNKQNNCNSSSDDEDQLASSSHSSKHRNFNIEIKHRSPANAGAEYKNLMEKLKRPHHMRTSLISNDDDDIQSATATVSNHKQKRSAYLHEEDVDADAWLIDDLGPDRKKRKYNTSTTPTKNRNVGWSTTNQNKTPTKNSTASSNWLRDSMSPENDAFQVLLDASSSTTTAASQQRQKQAKKLTLSRTSSICSNVSGASGTSNHTRTKSKHQSSLLDSGFCRFRSESPQSNMSGDDSNEFTKMTSMNITEPDSTTSTSIQFLISPRKSSPIKMQATHVTISAMVSFKVKVEDELLLVPIDRKKLNDMNMRWLAEEAARRYYNLIGLKPLLRLKTADGFAYEESDPVNVALEQSMILATVLEWQVSPLGQRYEEMCHQLNKTLNKDIQNVLEKAQISNAVEFSDFWLTPINTEPLFKALLHQRNLRYLDLSNNFIQNEGCRQLAKSLPTLQHLKTLNLKGNFITHEGLEALLNCNGIEKLMQLDELILSQNPLENLSLRILDKFCNIQNGKSLQLLHLSQCNFTNFYDYDLGFYELIDFDISFNQLTDETVRKLLLKLSASRLQYFNLSYTKPSTSFTDERNSTTTSSALADKIADFFESGTCEKFKCINLAGCQLNDVHIYKIVQCLSKSNGLETLFLSDNTRLSSSSLFFIIEKVPKLRKLIALNCPQLIVAEKTCERLAQLKSMPSMLSVTLNSAAEMDHFENNFKILWHSHWGDRGKFKVCNKNYTLYTNEKDLSVI